mmetsp:Transcript_49164/g.123587  ORF Transcript_49164/g.123587 Transcript_49164/m.123587 type:complete len:220 (-) Transcript_49164:251-910(-)
MFSNNIPSGRHVLLEPKVVSHIQHCECLIECHARSDMTHQLNMFGQHTQIDQNPEHHGGTKPEKLDVQLAKVRHQFSANPKILEYVAGSLAVASPLHVENERERKRDRVGRKEDERIVIIEHSGVNRDVRVDGQQCNTSQQQHEQTETVDLESIAFTWERGSFGIDTLTAHRGTLMIETGNHKAAHDQSQNVGGEQKCPWPEALLQSVRIILNHFRGIQ